MNSVSKVKIAVGYTLLLGVLFFSLFFVHREMEHLMLSDNRDVQWTDSLITLLRKKDANTIYMLRVLSETNDSMVSTREIENIIATRQDSFVTNQRVQQRIITHRDTVVTKPRKKGFFRRLGEVFVPPKKDTAIQVKTSLEYATDTVINVYNPVDSLQEKLRAVAQQQKEHIAIVQRRRRTLQRMDRMLTARIDSLLKGYEQETLQRARKEAEYQQSVRHHSIKTISGIAVGAVLLSVFFLIIIGRDITRSNRYRRELEEARRRAEDLLATREKMMLAITHDFKAPLGSIMGYADLLSRLTVDERQRFYLDNMKTSSEHLLKLVVDLLDFHRLDLHKAEINRVTFHPARLLEEIHVSFEPLTSAKGLELHCDIAPELESTYVCDPLRLRQIIYNLLSNAAKYTPDKGEIIIRIETGDDCSVCISVANSGELMTQQTIDGLFRRLYDGNYRKHHTIGTGIGLSLVKDHTALHRGSNRVSSDEQDGSCFRITLPIGRDAYTEEEIDDDTGDDAAEKIYEGAGEFVPVQPDAAMTDTPSRTRTDHTLLVFDDNEELLLLISNLLAPYFRIETASDGEEALRILSRQPVDLVVSDIMMPGMDGIELCRRLKQTFEYCNIPVILLTATNADESRIEGYNSGADGYVTKPFNLQLLYAQIVNQLRKLEIRGLHFRNQPVFEVEKLEYTSMDEKFMRQAMACVNAHIDDCEFAQADFTREMNMSRTILTEILKSLSGLTPAAFIIDVRLRAAYHLLEEQKKMRIADLAYASGFNDPKYFSTCFRKKFGFSPKEFIDRLNEKGDKIA